MKKHKMNEAKKFITICEGARYVGKTYLLSKVKDMFPVYKFPFKNYYDLFFPDITKNDNREIFHAAAGFDLSVHDLYKNDLVENGIVLDRGFLSNIIFGLQAKRIDFEYADKMFDFILESYGDTFHIMYIEAEDRTDDRNKDVWNFYNKSETVSLYNRYIPKLVEMGKATVFQNKFDDESVKEFYKSMYKVNFATV